MPPISVWSVVSGMSGAWLGENGFGFDFKNKSVTFIDDGKRKSLSRLASKPSVSQWKNKPFYIGNFTVSQRDMLDSVHQVTGSTDAD
ncbi:hypothetical protein EYZ11_011605 [Aspergillus tanneri]|uniref:Uncharacterized protein n=1 Tax=Aspergillus tanneri TaxID=1220188 RepID=A0A4S3J7Q7_9EURO|nr:hypothetical protein EYZ11_011605 [Aspergillus tanneri]